MDGGHGAAASEEEVQPMSMRRCCVYGCKNMVREGLRRSGLVKGCDGQELADGQTCWRCRARQAREDKKVERRNEKDSGKTGRSKA